MRAITAPKQKQCGWILVGKRSPLHLIPAESCQRMIALSKEEPASPRGSWPSQLQQCLTSILNNRCPAYRHREQGQCGLTVAAKRGQSHRSPARTSRQRTTVLSEGPPASLKGSKPLELQGRIGSRLRTMIVQADLMPRSAAGSCSFTSTAVSIGHWEQRPNHPPAISTVHCASKGRT